MSFRHSARHFVQPQQIIFVAIFSRNGRVTALKLGTQILSGSMYCEYQSQDKKPITLGVTFLDRFENLPIMKNVSLQMTQEL